MYIEGHNTYNGISAYSNCWVPEGCGQKAPLVGRQVECCEASVLGEGGSVAAPGCHLHSHAQSQLELNMIV